MSEFTMNQLYIISKTIFYSLTSILIFIFVSYFFYSIFLIIRDKNSKETENDIKKDILCKIYSNQFVNDTKIEQTLNRLYSEKQYYQNLYITFFTYSITAVNIFLGIIVAIYKNFPELKDYFFSLTLIASVVLYFIYVYMDNISVQIGNQSIAIKYLEERLNMNIQSFSFNGYYKSSSNILIDRFILQYIVLLFASVWIIAGALISLNKENVCGSIFLSIVALLTFPFLHIIEKYFKKIKD